METRKRHRLITKGDFDGLVCAVLLKEMDIIDEVVFAHPRDIESGKIEVTGRDITAGLPYNEKVYLAFDYYPGAAASGGGKNLIIDSGKPSTSRVIYDYFGRKKFPRIQEDMLNAVDKGFSGDITIEEILYPTGWILFNYLVDQRTGLERFRKFSLTHSDLLIKLIYYCRRHTIWEIFNIPAIEERHRLYFSSIEQYKTQMLRCSSVHYNLVVTDMRNEKIIYPGNRFMVYALFPECNVSMNVSLDVKNGRTVFVAGKSILDRSFSADIGRVMKKYGGGGHSKAGTCQAGNDDADTVMRKLISEFKYPLFKNLFLGYFNYYYPLAPEKSITN
ncbi:MAG: hypothetical protein A2077_06180 [Nitrospirae bacterium GWC2_46_6]|nr:MAG: hypothetical protein A2077_06180 [Nitrospirae bacterium GWC2_46_6]OGW22220.1 MAG: hypothetical protein A2Z82_09820 [Nitrospirae bacterium GWA2_46_11]OGW23248.1 MAG: hypothetical protein A2X55_09780 [Nitrospirae bacterium GWB2_47_37]